MKIQENVSLAQYTTFKIGGPASFFCLVQSEKELIEAINFAKNEQVSFFVLGGGSNLLVSDEGYGGLVIKIENKGISYSGNFVTAASGENWDDFVLETINRGLFGLENLSAIPGTVGASPIQNIGAYGVEVSNYIDSVYVYDTRKNQFISLKNSDCLFEYRDSVFKHQKGRYIIVSVTFKLKKDAKVDISYKDLVNYFTVNKLDHKPLPIDVRDAVIKIRNEKLPDWKSWGTAGSFFKNPIIPIRQFIDLKQKYPEIPGFPESNGRIKIPLGWILDKVCNIKGFAVGNARVYEKQALVLVTKPGARASEVIELSQKIQALVKEKTGLTIEAEVEWVN